MVHIGINDEQSDTIFARLIDGTIVKKSGYTVVIRASDHRCSSA